jgi:glucose/mannose-6-phosphate isomerase
VDSSLGRTAVAAVDTSGQVADILDLGTHIRDALWRVEAAALPPVEAPDGLVVAGMGGSGIGGSLGRAVLWPALERPFALAGDYDVPPWTGPGHAVLCASYSGDTEETVAAYDAAGERGSVRFAATSGGELAARARRDGVPVIPLPGGFQPRAAVGYGLTVALEVAAHTRVAPADRPGIEAAAALADDLAAEWGPDGAEDGEAKRLARSLHGTIPVVTGLGVAAAAAYRWKSQINENAKVPAFSAALPEAGHNEIAGWADAGQFGRFAAVFLEDPEAGERGARRVALTVDIVAGEAATVERIVPRGNTSVERLVSLVLLGDLVSLYLAVLRGADPIDIAPIDRLKAGLAAR